MMKTSIALIISVSAFAWAEDAGKTALPEKADKIIQGLNNDVIEIKKKALVQLEKVMSDEMKRGNLDGANVIKAEKDRIIKEIKGESPDANWYLGQWRAEMGAMYELKADNVCIVNGQLSGKYIIDDKSIKMTWPNGYVDTIIKVAESKFVMSNNAGQKFSIKKL